MCVCLSPCVCVFFSVCACVCFLIRVCILRVCVCGGQRERWNTVKQKQNSGSETGKKKREKHLSIKKRENVILLRAHTSTLISSFSLTGVPPRGHHHYIWTHLFPSPPPTRHWGCNLVPLAPAEAETSLINPLVFNQG